MRQGGEHGPRQVRLPDSFLSHPNVADYRLQMPVDMFARCAAHLSLHLEHGQVVVDHADMIEVREGEPGAAGDVREMSKSAARMVTVGYDREDVRRFQLSSFDKSPHDVRRTEEVAWKDNPDGVVVECSRSLPEHPGNRDQLSTHLPGNVEAVAGGGKVERFHGRTPLQKGPDERR